MRFWLRADFYAPFLGGQKGPAARFFFFFYFWKGAPLFGEGGRLLAVGSGGGEDREAGRTVGRRSPFSPRRRMVWKWLAAWFLLPVQLLGLAAKALVGTLLPSRLRDLSGDSVLITGGGRGIGRHLAREFAKRGARKVSSARGREPVAAPFPPLGSQTLSSFLLRSGEVSFSFSAGFCNGGCRSQRRLFLQREVSCSDLWFLRR